MNPPTAPLTRVLAWVSWLCVGGAVLVAATALFGHWAVNATSLGARDMGWAIYFASFGALALVASLYAAPVLAALGVLALLVQWRIALRFLAAGAVMALPLAVLAWQG